MAGELYPYVIRYLNQSLDLLWLAVVDIPSIRAMAGVEEVVRLETLHPMMDLEARELQFRKEFSLQ